MKEVPLHAFLTLKIVPLSARFEEYVINICNIFMDAYCVDKCVRC